jgi:hypothetical protein
MRYSRCLLLVSCLLGLVLLRQAILLMDDLLLPRKEQSQLILQQELHPAALFYTESPQALAAEKMLRKRLVD